MDVLSPIKLISREDSEAAIARIYERMSVMFGRTFTSVNGLKPVDEKGRLTISAETWLICLGDVSLNQISQGLNRLMQSPETYSTWGVSVMKFKELCLQRNDAPTLTESLAILHETPRINGSIANRYKHPMTFAIVQNRAFSEFEFRYGSHAQREAMVKPIYEQLLKTGWDGFKPEHYEEVKALPVLRSDPETAKRHFANLHAILGGSHG
jgi:hypothetical protein